MKISSQFVDCKALLVLSLMQAVLYQVAYPTFTISIETL